MTRNKKKQKSKRPEKAPSQSTKDSAESRLQPNAAQTVFNTPELLEQILKQMTPMSFGLRLVAFQVLSRRYPWIYNFTMPATDRNDTAYQRPRDRGLSETGALPRLLATIHCWKYYSTERVLIRSHPNVMPLVDVTTHSVDAFLKQGFTHMVSPEAMKTVSPPQFIFEPPLRKVMVSYHGERTIVVRQRGVTFGTITEELGRMRKACQDRITEIVQFISARSNRAAYAKALAKLNGPLDGCWYSCHAVEEDPFVYIRPEIGVGSA